MMPETHLIVYRSGAMLQVSNTGSNKYEIKQHNAPTPHSKSSYDSYAIQYSFGPVGV